MGTDAMATRRCADGTGRSLFPGLHIFINYAKIVVSTRKEVNMELKDWLSLITSWVAIGVSIWLGLRQDKRKRRKRKKK